MFHTILIANRGEIACRIIRTARRMGIRTIAVCSAADQNALHATMADAAYTLGPAPAAESYLRVDAILAAARASGTQAIHPGYGFLSENAAFAEACTAAGLVFIGPTADAIRAMGSKSAAKALMQRAGVPLVPGYHGDNQDPALLATEAARIGYPVLIKASAGGGGKGMRVVERASDFADALVVAKSEARASFGDDHVLIERYLTRPRHIEIQVFADSHGRTVSLFERDCSIQRRHQKIIEEAPAPGMMPLQRQAMGDAACAAARAVGYVGAGTVEFITEGAGTFYFMEMNTRLQVEHPVTELVTGLDLVEWQLLVAAGEPLPPVPAAPVGHAIEVRVYAEDPARDFMPATGTIAHLAWPAPGAHVRIDAGVQQGDTVGVHYDPMLAKLIVWDETRALAVARLQAALAQAALVGVHTNLDLLRRIATHAAFAAGALDTGFIARYGDALLPAHDPTPRRAVLAVAQAILDAQTPPPDTADPRSPDPWSPWAQGGGWRLGGSAAQALTLIDTASTYHVTAVWRPALVLSLDGVESAVDGPTIDGLREPATVLCHSPVWTAVIDGRNWPFTLADPLAPNPAAASVADHLLAPMPGRIVEVRVGAGDSVAENDVLIVLEAMKVQMRLVAPRAGTLAQVRVTPGDLVQDGMALVTFDPVPEIEPTKP